ncbi:MAG: HIT family protein [Gammaproteobacteria bacterium]|jgi:diadenosine tetraphosphate (Ap4A) HIT family hydrolase
MEQFKLDEQLVKGSFILGELDTNLLLLMNNKVAPWFILVPQVAGVTELYELDTDTQLSLLNEINQLSRFVTEKYTVDKLNVAAIGNIVKQLHIHVVARTEKDNCWPGVVWGTDFDETYTEEEVENLINLLCDKLPGFSRT